MTVAERNRHYRAIRRAKGLCVFCTNPIASESVCTCANHLAYQRDARRSTPQTSRWRPGSRGPRPLWASLSTSEAA
jgi:hypothetical protein